MSTLGLKRSSEDIMAAVAQVLVLQLITQDLLGEARFIALHGRRRGRFLRGHGVCSHVAPGEGEIRQSRKTFIAHDATQNRYTARHKIGFAFNCISFGSEK